MYLLNQRGYINYSCCIHQRNIIFKKNIGKIDIDEGVGYTHDIYDTNNRAIACLWKFCYLERGEGRALIWSKSSLSAAINNMTIMNKNKNNTVSNNNNENHIGFSEW